MVFKRYALGALTLLAVSAGAALADHKLYVGRTGLPTVQEGKNDVWMERGSAVMQVRGSDLVITQEFRLQYPGRKLEKKPTRIKVAIREDYTRSGDNGGDVTASEAKGFKKFTVSVDGRRVSTDHDAWMINDKGDTATRWNSWWVSFRPGQERTMKIVTVAPVGRDGNHRIVQFVSKDLGRWRRSPDVLEIRFQAPGLTETKLAGLEPEPDDQTSRGIRWVYRKASPNRDVFIMLPDRGSHPRS
jgi:hypothetical protein